MVKTEGAEAGDVALTTPPPSKKVRLDGEKVKEGGIDDQDNNVTSSMETTVEEGQERKRKRGKKQKGALQHCKICNQNFDMNKKGQYLEHLLKYPHRSLGPPNWIRHWKEEEFKARVILVTANQQVNRDSRIVHYFYKKDPAFVVTDFVWWKQRPEIGFIQFENTEQVDQIIALHKDTEGKVELNKLVLELKAGSSFSESEWDELLHPDVRSEIGFKTEDESTLTTGESGSGYFSKILETIHSDISIPDEENSGASDLLSRIYKMFIQEEENSPSSSSLEYRVWMLRSWALKLRHHNYQFNRRATYLILQKEKDSPLLKEVSNSVIDKLLVSNAHPQFKRVVHKAVEMTSEEFDKLPVLNYTAEVAPVKYENEQAKLEFPSPFKVYGQTKYAVEAQLWLFAKSMASYDPRVEPVLEIVFYWANKNRVNFGTQTIQQSDEMDVSLPEPLALTWLVLYYFYCGNGPKLIPTPLKLLAMQPKESLKASENGPDLGFLQDRTFREKWLAKIEEKSKTGKFPYSASDEKPENKEKLSLQILEIAADLFKTIGTKFGGGEFIINGRIGTDLDTKYFINSKLDFSKEKIRKKFAGNTEKEWLELQESIKKEIEEGNGKVEKEQTKQQSKKNESRALQQTRIKFITPFSLNWSFPVDSSIFPKMRHTGQKLQEFLSNFKSKDEKGNDDDQASKKNVDKYFIENLFRFNHA